MKISIKESSLYLLRAFDQRQLYRLFVDGRFHKKYDGWVGYEKGERGSVQALLNAFSYMLDHFDLRDGLKSTYLTDLHKVCMMGVQTKNLKSSPGDLRYLNSGMPFYAKTTTLENLHEILAMRRGDGTAVFNSKAWARPADELDAQEVYDFIQREGRLNFRNWYPNLEPLEHECLQKLHGLQAFYQVKHKVQMMFAQRVDEIVERFNQSMTAAHDDDARLWAMALVVRELELLHPFPDGNCRTVACVLLTQLLLNYGMTPSLLENPNLDGECSMREWIVEIKKGMALFVQLLRQPETRVYDYAVDDQSAESQQKFADMSKELVAKIQQTNMLYLNPQNIETYTGGRWLKGQPAGLLFTGVGTYGTYRKGNIYFALEIQEWLKAGKDVRAQLTAILAKHQVALVIDREEYASGWDIPVFLVKNAFAAFKAVAINVRKDLNPWTILVTGTEGKTGAKVQLHHVLKSQVSAHAVINSANTEVPVLRSLASLCVDHHVEVNEVSVGSDENYRIERTMMVNPDLCLFTNIGPNHMDMHGSIPNLLNAKSSVVVGLREGGLSIVNSANEYFEGLMQANYKRRPDANTITYGVRDSDEAQLLSSSFDAARLGWEVSARIEDVTVSYFVPLPNSHAPLASVGILLAVKRSGFDVQRAAAEYASLKPYETMGSLVRLQKNGGDILFYDQSRRGGISGMRSAFADIANMKVKGRVVALVGGISVLRDGDWTREVHQQLAELINNSPIDRLYTTGNYSNYVHDHLKRPLIKHTNNLDELAVDLVNELEPGDLLFIIGSAYLYLGRVADQVVGILQKGQALPALVISEEPHASRFRMLKVYEAVAQGVGAKKSSATHGIKYPVYVASLATTPDYVAYRALMLQDFFAQLPDHLAGMMPLKLVDSELCKGRFARHVLTPDSCVQWFNNLDKNQNLPAKQCFGSFFDFGDPQYLLHIEVATFALHVGLVRCTKTPAGYVPEPMTQAMFDGLCQRWPQLLNLGVQLRAWGPRWASLDLGALIHVTQPEVFMAMSDLSKSPKRVQMMRDFLYIIQPQPLLVEGLLS